MLRLKTVTALFSEHHGFPRFINLTAQCLFRRNHSALACVREECFWLCRMERGLTRNTWVFGFQPVVQMTRKHVFSGHNYTHVSTEIITLKQVIDCLDHLGIFPLISVSILKTTLQHFISAFFIIPRRRESTISCSSTADCPQFLLVLLEPLERRVSSLPLRVSLCWVLDIDIITP